MQSVLTATENGFGKRTPITEYPVKGRGTMGVQTIKLTDKKGQLVRALIVKEGQELLFMSTSGMVQRTSVEGISRYKRAAQGVRLMNLREDDQVSAVARVVEGDVSDAADNAPPEELPSGAGPAMELIENPDIEAEEAVEEPAE